MFLEVPGSAALSWICSTHVCQRLRYCFTVFEDRGVYMDILTLAEQACRCHLKPIQSTSCPTQIAQSCVHPPAFWLPPVWEYPPVRTASITDKNISDETRNPMLESRYNKISSLTTNRKRQLRAGEAPR